MNKTSSDADSSVFTPGAVTPKVPLWTSDFVLLTLANFVTFLGFYCLIPVMPKFAESLGANENMIGLIIGAFSISALFVRPFTGNLVDRGNRRLVLIVAMSLFSLSFVSYAYAESFNALLILRLVHGISWGVLGTTLATFAADIVPAPRRGEGLGFYGMASSVAMTLGPTIGVMALFAGSYAFAFAAAGAIVWMGMVFSALVKIPAAQGRGSQAETGWRRFIEVRAIPLALLLFFSAFMYSGIISFIPLYAEQFGLGSSALFFAVFAGGVLLSRPFSGRLFDRLGENIIIPPGLLAMCACVLLLGITQEKAWYLVAATLGGIGFGTVSPAYQAMAINRVEPRRRGAANATLITAMDLGIGIGSITLGVVAGFFDYRSMFIVSSLSGVAALAYFWHIIKPNPKERLG
ncbi:MAG: MFS transporter [Candidatus Brocadiia bacterium]